MGAEQFESVKPAIKPPTPEVKQISAPIELAEAVTFTVDAQPVEAMNSRGSCSQSSNSSGCRSACTSRCSR